MTFYINLQKQKLVSYDVAKQHSKTLNNEKKLTLRFYQKKFQKNFK